MSLAGWENADIIQMALDSSLIDADLTDFVMDVKLGAAVGKTGFDATAVFDALAANSKKIAFEIGDTGVQCYCEVISWDDANTTAHLCIKVPTATAATDQILNFYYDPAHADNTTYIGDTGSTPAQQVWPVNHAVAQAMSQDPSAGNLLDSTANGNHGVPSNLAAGQLVDMASPLFGKGIDFAGDATEQILIPADATVDTTQKTLVLHVDLDEHMGSNDGTAHFVSKNSWFFATDQPNNRYIFGQNWTTTIGRWSIPLPSLDPHVIIITYDRGATGNDPVVTVDGVQQVVTEYATPAGSIVSDSSDDLYIANYVSAPRDIDGRIGCFRYINEIMSANWVAFTSAAMRDELITWSVAGGIVANRAAIDMLYGDLTAMHRVIADMVYSILFDCRAYVDIYYGLRLLAFADLHYGDKPMPRAIVDMYYWDCPILRRVWDLKHGDLRMIRRYWDLNYVIPKEMRAILDIRYGINGDEVRAFVDMGYDIMDVNLLRQIVDMPYVLQAGNLLQTIETSVIIGGRKVKCSHVNVEGSLDERFISAEIHLPNVADYVPIKREESFVVVDTLDGVSQEIHLLVENKRISRPAPGKRVYIVTALSKIMTLSAPWSRPLAEDPAPGPVVDVVDGLLGDVGPVDWQTVTFPVLPDTLYGVDEDRIDVARRLSGSVGAKFQSNLDGSVRVIQEYQVSPPAWADADPDYSLSARDFVSQDDTPVHNPGHNKFLVGNETDSKGSTWSDQEDVSDSEVEVMGFQVPWGYTAVLGLTHTGGDHVPESAYVGIVEELYPPEGVDPEQVTFEGGYASTSRPVYTEKLDGTPVPLQVEWQDDSLGTVTAEEDGSLEAEIKDGVSEGHGLADMRYLTRYHLWRVHNDVHEDVLYILWVGEN